VSPVVAIQDRLDAPRGHAPERSVSLIICNDLRLKRTASNAVSPKSLQMSQESQSSGCLSTAGRGSPPLVVVRSSFMFGCLDPLM